MPKIKTNKSAAKRFKITKKGKVRHSKTCRSHLLVKKGKATKKNKFGKQVHDCERRAVRRLLPYAKVA